MAHALRRRTGTLAGILVAVLMLTGIAAAPASAAGTSSVMPTKRSVDIEISTAEFEDRILQLLNADRAKKGMGALKRVQELDTVARNWSEQMAREGAMYHNPKFAQQSPSGWRSVGENVAMGYQTPEAMYEGWYDSPGHYANMFNPDFTHIGIGIAYRAENTFGFEYTAPYGTQNFATYPSSKKLTPTPKYKAPKPAPAPKPTTPIPSDNGSTTKDIDDGGIGGEGSTYFLNNRLVGGDADTVFKYGNTRGRVYVGDWDGDGRDTLAYRIGNTFYVRDSNSAGPAHAVIKYGRTGDRIYVGDWNGDGRDTFAVRRGAEYHFKNSMSGGDADKVIRYGREGDDILVGDWNGDRRDTLAVRRGSVYHFKNTIRGGDADRVVNYGRSDDDVYVGDWDGDGRDTLAVRRGKAYHLKNAIRGGNADQLVLYGRADDTTLIGDWNRDGRDTIGIRRWPMR